MFYLASAIKPLGIDKTSDVPNVTTSDKKKHDIRQVKLSKKNYLKRNLTIKYIS